MNGDWIQILFALHESEEEECCGRDRLNPAPQPVQMVTTGWVIPPDGVKTQVEDMESASCYMDAWYKAHPEAKGETWTFEVQMRPVS